MTNKEKFKEVFGMKMGDTSDCGFFDCTDKRSCEDCPVKDTKAWWNAEYKEPTTNNDLGVDCISRADAIKSMQDKAKKLTNKDTINGLCGAVAILFDMPSVTPQEPQSFKWCTDCKEYDQEKHCCHRWSKVIRNTVEEMKQEPKTGHWIERHDDWGSGIITNKRYKCSVCHGKHIDPETGEWHEVFDYKYPFCPNCGAKMESEG